MFTIPRLDELSLQAVARRYDGSVALDDDAVACVVLATNTLINTAGRMEVVRGGRLLDNFLTPLARRLARGDAARIVGRLEHGSTPRGALRGTIPDLDDFFLLATMSVIFHRVAELDVFDFAHYVIGTSLATKMAISHVDSPQVPLFVSTYVHLGLEEFAPGRRAEVRRLIGRLRGEEESQTVH